MWRFVKGAHVFVWGTSALSFVVAGASQASGWNAIGYTPDGTCWLRNHFVYLFYVPLFVYWSICVGAVAYMFHILRSRGSRVGSKAFAMALNRMLLFTLAFIFTWAWPLIFQIVWP